MPLFVIHTRLCIYNNVILENTNQGHMINLSASNAKKLDPLMIVSQ